MYQYFKILIFIATLVLWSQLTIGQVKVTNQKGSILSIDTSKWSSSGNNMFNKNSGNIGVGTNNPAAKFHTVGTVRLQGLSSSTSNTNILTVDANGNVTRRALSSLFNGNAITSLNGLTSSTQIFTIGSSGTNVNISSSGTEHTFNFPNASGINSGILTNTDWTTFNNKENNIPTGSISQYWRGDKTWQTLNTSAVAESGNLYFTNARARTSISLTTTGTDGVATYDNTTGVLNVPNYTLSGLGGIGLTSLSATTPLTYNNTTGTFGISQANGTTSGFLSSADWSSFNNKENAIASGSTGQYWRGDKTWQTLNTSAVAESGNLYFTNTRARTSISLTTTGTDGVATYDNTTGVLNVPNYTLSGLGGIGLTSLSATTPLIYNNTTGTFGISQANGTTSGFLSSADWSSFNNKENAIASGSTGQYWRGDKTWQTLNTSAVAESGNLYFTNARARTSISLTTTGTNGVATYDNNTGVLNVPNYTLSGLGGIGLTSLSATTPLTYNNTTGIFGISQANGATSGFLTSADWSSFNNKENAIASGSTAQYWRGDKTWQTLNTSAVAESGNLYFTNARARTSISLTTTGTNGVATYNNTTGVLNVPNYTLSGLGGIGLTSLSATTPLIYNNTTGTFGISQANGTTSGFLSSADWSSFNNKENPIASGSTGQYWRGDKTWQTLNTSAVAESGNLYFTNARARTSISLTTTGTNGVATYDNNTGVLNIPNYTLSGLGGIGLTSLSATTPLTYNNTTGTFGISQANGTTSGFLTSADWSSFNNKIGAINATLPVTATTSSGTTSIAINRNNIVTGISSNSATTPLNLDSGATNAVVGGSNATITVNNTAPLWNANQLQGRNISNTTPTDKEVLTWDATTNTWRPSQFYTVTNIATTTYTLSNNDHGKILDFTSSSSISLTVPNSLPVGFQVSITQAGNGQITVVGSGGMVINNRWAGTTTSGRWAKAGLEIRATNSAVLSGDVQ